jgi:hypothetical protein
LRGWGGEGGGGVGGKGGGGGRGEKWTKPYMHIWIIKEKWKKQTNKQTKTKKDDLPLHESMKYLSKFPWNSSQNQKRNTKFIWKQKNPNHPKHSCVKLAVLEASYYLISNYTTEPNIVNCMAQAEKYV